MLQAESLVDKSEEANERKKFQTEQVMNKAKPTERKIRVNKSIRCSSKDNQVYSLIFL